MMSQDDINNLMAGIDNDISPLNLDENNNIDTSVQDNDTSVSTDDNDDFDLDSLVNEFANTTNTIDDELDIDSSNDEITDNDNIDTDNLDINELDLDSLNSESELNNTENSNNALDALESIDDDDFDVNNLDIEALASSISTDTENTTDDLSNENITDDNIDMSVSENNESNNSEQEYNLSNEEFTTQIIDQGIIPLPVEKDTKVVNQLNQVAKDGEEKATQIFDVLSYIMDENNELQLHSKQIDELAKSQAQILEILTQKFPKINQFKQALEQSKEISSKSSIIREKIDSENMKLFEAMELMQFQDINRQKIERVMSVIKKLSDYLNNLFEDEEGATDNLAIAKQIHGDDSQAVDSDDLESLIHEYSNENN